MNIENSDNPITERRKIKKCNNTAMVIAGLVVGGVALVLSDSPPKVITSSSIEGLADASLGLTGTNYISEMHEADEPNNPYKVKFKRIIVTSGVIRPNINGLQIQILDAKGNFYTEIPAGMSIDITERDIKYIGKPIAVPK